MPSKALTSLLAGGLIVSGAASLRAQSLGDVARKEEERRKAVPAAVKVYTNKDLSGKDGSGIAAPPADGSSEKEKGDKPGDKSTAKGAGDKAGADSADPAKPEKPAADQSKDQKYWHDRIAAARVALERDTGYADAMQTRVNALTTDFVNRDDPAQRGVVERDRQRAVSELERLRKQIVDDKKAITEIEDEARRSGVPPGWLR